jgi:hypothetical protein
MSPMMVRASEKRPPAPSPWKARAAASWYIESARPDSNEPTTNSTIAVMNHGRRP